MAQKTSKNAVMGSYQTRGEDFLHLVDTNGSDLGGIDPTGAGWGALQGGGGLNLPPTKILFVDGNRTDTYVADGSLSKPFKAIMGAVNQIVSNGDNSTQNYVVWVNPGLYTETIDLSNSALVNLTFVGYGATVNTQGIGFTDVLRIVGNNSLTDLKMIGFKFLGGSTNGLGITVSSTTNGTNLLNGSFYSWGLWFKDCNILTANVTITNAGGVFLDGCSVTSKTTFNNVNQIEVRTCTINTSNGGWSINTNNGNPAPVGFSNTNLLMRYNLFAENLTVNAGSNSSLYWNRMVQTTTIFGTVTSFFCAITAVVVNSGGSFSERSSTHSTLTVNAGGTYSSVSYVTNVGGLTLNGAAPSTPAGVLGLGNGTAASATAGADTLPANPAGFLVANLGGTPIKIPFYNN